MHTKLDDLEAFNGPHPLVAAIAIRSNDRYFRSLRLISGSVLPKYMEP